MKIIFNLLKKYFITNEESKKIIKIKRNQIKLLNK